MATTSQARFDFLKMFIEKLFDQSGFAEMTEASRQQFVPLFTAEAERRLGLALVPLLSVEQADELVKIADSDGTTTDDLANFWKRSVPNFEQVVEKTLNDFAAEFKKMLAKAK